MRIEDAPTRGDDHHEIEAQGPGEAANELLVVEIETASACNRTCWYCPNSKHKRPSRGRMPESLFRKILSDLAERSYAGRLSFHFYNEPLLDKRLCDFVALARQALPESYIKLFTNGDLLTPARFRQLVSAGMSRICITDHGGAGDALEKCMAELRPDERDMVRLQTSAMLSLSNRGGIVPLVQLVNEPLDVPCALPMSRMVITLSGNIVLCCEDYFEQMVIGNVEKQSIWEIWDSPRLNRIRERLARGDRRCTTICRHCSNVGYTHVDRGTASVHQQHERIG